MLGKRLHVVGLTVTPHETNTGDLLSVFLQKRIQCAVIQNIPYVFTKMWTVAAHTSVRTISEIHREGHLIGNLLEDNIVVVVF